MLSTIRLPCIPIFHNPIYFSLPRSSPFSKPLFPATSVSASSFLFPSNFVARSPSVPLFSFFFFLSLSRQSFSASSISLSIYLSLPLFLSPLGLELIVQNLSRLDESNDEDAQGVNSSMGCIENLVEIRPDIAILICERTHILKFLLLRLKVFISSTQP